MSDSKEQQPAGDAIRAKSEHPGAPAQPTNPHTRGKHWHFAGLIILVPVVVIALIVYRAHSLPASCVGLGIALCAVACGVILVRRLIRLMKAEDGFQEQQADGIEAPIAPPEPNSTGPETNRTPSPPGAG